MDTRLGSWKKSGRQWRKGGWVDLNIGEATADLMGDLSLQGLMVVASSLAAKRRLGS